MSAFVQLKTLAKNTVVQSDDYLLHEIDVLLELYNQLDAKIQEIEEQVVKCIRGINPPMLSIPGIGALSAAIFLSEYGDFGKFDSPAKLLSFPVLKQDTFNLANSNWPHGKAWFVTSSVRSYELLPALDFQRACFRRVLC